MSYQNSIKISTGNPTVRTRGPSEAPPAPAEDRRWSLLAPLGRAGLEVRDRLINSPAVRTVLSRWIRCRAHQPAGDDPQALARSIERLCTAARLAPTPAMLERVEEEILRRVQRLDATRLEWGRLLPDFHSRTLEKAVILKPRVSEREKGVLFISFGNQWVRLLGLHNLQELARSYTLVLAPGWSPPHDLINYVFPRSYPDAVFSLISNRRDLETLPRLSRGYRVVPLYASSWVNPDFFRPLPAPERDIDIIMVANFSRIKRHFAFFKTLRKMPSHLNVVLIGQDQDGRSWETIYKEARYYNVHRRLTILRNVPYRGVAEALCRSRVSLILSRREGSCVVVAESLFANTPVGMLADAHVGSRAFINESTGCLLEHGDCSGQLRDFLARSAEYSPRDWAERNISCHRSTVVLNEAIRSHMRATGQEWTRDLAPLCWCPDPRLVDPEDHARMRDARAELQDRFGLVIGTE
jgi:glycosyltransferase involved in cell wall biosynthesis